MKKGLLLFLSAILIVTVTGCGTQKSKENTLAESISASRNAVYSETVTNDPAAPAPKEQPSEAMEPKVIKTANISIEVVDYLKSRQKVDSIVAKNLGYITNESYQESDALKSNSITIRVPANNLSLLLSDIAAIAKRVEYQNVFTQDVTEEYIDTKTRLENKLAVEKTYRKHLNEAKNIDDILKIENKLAEIRSEIESAQGRLKYIDHQVNLSTVSLYFYQRLEYKYIPEELPGFWQRVKEGFHWGWKSLIWFLILIVKLWPLWFIGIASYLTVTKVKTYLKRHKKKEKKAKKQNKKNRQPEETPM